MADPKIGSAVPMAVAARVAARRAAEAKPKGPSDDKIYTWPHLVRVEFLCTLLIIAGMLVWSLLVDAPLEEPAAPTRTPNPSKAPWYFLGLQEILVYFDPWHAGVVLPSLIIVGLMVLPYIDTNAKGNGYYTFQERKYEILTFFLGFHVLWILFIVVGTFLRGPGWNWFWPWQPWDTHKVVAMSNVDLPFILGFREYWAQAAVGLTLTLLYFVIGTAAMYLWILRKKGKEFLERWGVVRFGLTAFLFLNMAAVVVKMVLRLGFNVKYVMVTPWINI
jgi:hypothetical protein